MQITVCLDIACVCPAANNKTGNDGIGAEKYVRMDLG